MTEAKQKRSQTKCPSFQAKKERKPLPPLPPPPVVVGSMTLLCRGDWAEVPTRQLSRERSRHFSLILVPNCNAVKKNPFFPHPRNMYGFSMRLLRGL